MSSHSPSGLLPRFETLPILRIAGTQQRYTSETRHLIPDQWDQFASRIGSIPHQVGMTSYGVCLNFDPQFGFDYLSGVEVSATSDLPADLTVVELAPQQYAVFTHPGHYSQLPETFRAIWEDWYPGSGREAAHAPGFERYTEEFNPETGSGGTEVWLPVCPLSA